MTQTESSDTSGMSIDHAREAAYDDEMQTASDQVRSDSELKRMGVVLSDETLKCACGNEARIVGPVRVMRGTDIHCGACGLPLIVFGPTVITVEQQRDSLLHMLRKFTSPGVVLRSIFRNRSASVADLVHRIGEEKKRPYTIELHRQT